MAALLHRLEAPRARAYWLIALACALPRVAVLVHERVTVLYAFVEKSDRFAATFVDSGTFGLIPGEPSAYTQPIYGFFLVPVYWIFGRHWWAMGGAQIVLAVATAWIVYEIGRRLASPRVGLLAALAATLHPYLVWHDVHVNREIVDHFLGVLLVLLTLVAVERRSWRWAGLLGVVLGLAILANSRLALLPVALAAYVAWRLRDRRLAALAVAAIVVGAGVAMAPWVVRNKVELGCFTVTTDARALWKANNTRTYDVVSRGLWIDDVPDLPNSPTSPADAFGKWDYGAGPVEHVDECAFQSYYQDRVVEFWKQHPGEKARLAAQATALLWDPRVNDFEGSNGDDSGLAQLRKYVEGTYMAVVFALAAIGIFRVPRRFAALALIFLAYETLAAAVFAGQTRYRVPWDFVLMLLAAYAAVSLRRTGDSAPSQER